MLRRIHGLDAAIAAFKNRSLASDGVEPLTDGGGIYDVAMTPEAFADRVIADVRSHGDEFVRRISKSLDGAEIDDFKVPAEVVAKANTSCGPMKSRDWNWQRVVWPRFKSGRCRNRGAMTSLDTGR